MRDSRKKGKIPKSEWPSIVERSRNNESFVSIARDYGCTAPAIRYIVNRSVPAAGESPGKPAPRPGAALSLPARQPSGAFSELRKRVTSDIALFLVAIDGADPSAPETMQRLHEATDAVMRAAARVLIEIERLEDAVEQSRRGGTSRASG
jgi:hypothetical protein